MVKGEKDFDTIFIGSKPFMNYVTSITMQFTAYNRKDLIVAARGKYILTAINATLVAMRFVKGINLEIINVEIYSEDAKNKEGKDIRVSNIKIKLQSK